MSLDTRSRSIGRCGVLVAATVALAAAGTQAAAQGASPPSSREVLRSMAKTLQAAKQFSFHTELNFDDVLDDGQLVQFAGATKIKVRRDDGLSVDYRDDLSAKQLWYDGKTLTLLDVGAGVYASAPAPPGLEATVEQFERDYGLFMPLSEIVVNDPYETTMAQARSGKYLGIHDVDGTPCHHLAFVGDQRDWQIWVETGKTPVPRKLVVTYKDVPGSPQYMANMMDWDLAAKLSDADFQAKVPEEASAIEFLAIEEARR